MATKLSKPHTSARKKKTASKRSQPAAKTKRKKAAERPAWEKRAELTLKMFQMVYEDYQQGKFQRIL